MDVVQFDKNRTVMHYSSGSGKSSLNTKGGKISRFFYTGKMKFEEVVIWQIQLQ